MEKYRPYKPMEQLNTWWVIEWPDKRIATFTDSEASTAERAAKEHADRMNREVVLADVKKWREEIERAQRNVNKVAVALDNMKSMITLKKKDLPGKFDPAGEYTRLKSRITIECE